MHFGPLERPLVEQIERARADFEAAWRAGLRPRIEDYLNPAPEPGRTILLQVLLARELDLRRSAGEAPAVDEYIERFSPRSDAVRAVFSEVEYGLTELAAEASTVSHPGTSGTTEAAPSGRSTGPLSPSSDVSGAPPGSGGPSLPDRIGPYRNLRILGEGGFGRVYYSRHDDLDREVAIKVARAGLLGSSEREELLLHEARLAAGLKHPAIVTVYDVGRLAGGSPYIVFEYIEGQSLSRKFREDMPPRTALVRLLARVADATHHAHRAGLVHRDLKPSNILIDAQGEPHVTDFGLALNEDLRRLRTGQIAGTPAFMAPEQVRGETHRLDGRTDIWSLGVILYEGLTGRLPFPGRERRAIYHEILEREPVPLRQIDEGVPQELERICLKCLAKRMTDRYTSAAELAEDLRAWLEADGGGTGPAPRPTEAPGRAAPVLFKGLRAFEQNDARYFLDLLPGPRGRDGLPESIRFWKTRIDDYGGERAFSVGLLYGPSGGGKSSLVRAGLLPRLDERVRAVHVEASTDRTEAELSAALRRALPALPEGCGPAEALAEVRGNRLAPRGVKLLVVLDQFEQWLHAHPDEPQAELVRALRQCDGRRLQALLLVRDDFWMAITRFFKALEVPLVEGGNSAPVELFDAAHARQVLVEYGRSCGRVGEGPEGPGSETDRFLDQAVGEMIGTDGRVAPVRLSLFTEVVRRRPWTPATLRALGGFEGIGVTFLVEAFDSDSAPPSYRIHRHAALAVLQTLLPAPSSVVRERLHTGRELCAAAGYTEQPGQFAELMRILDTELRLVTPVDPSGGAPHEHEGEPGRDHSAADYQLAHDFLIGPIRQWVEQKQQATRPGRARHRLATITASWADRPAPQRLASPLEWADILWHTRWRSWSAQERRMMRAATRHHMTRAALSLAAIAAVWFLIETVRTRERARSVLELALKADYPKLPDLFPALATHRARLRAALERLEYDRSAPTHDRTVATLLLYRDRPTQERAQALHARLAVAGSDELEVIRRVLAEHPREARAEKLRGFLQNEILDPPVRLHAAALLAALEPVDPQLWQPAAPHLIQALLAEDHQTLPRWVTMLDPAFPLLAPVLAGVCRDANRDPSARATAAEILAMALENRGDLAGLAQAVTESQPEASLILLHRLEQQTNSGPAVSVFQGLLDQPATGRASEDQVGRKSAAIIALAVLGEPGALWSSLRHAPDPRLRTKLIHIIASLALAPRLLRDRLSVANLDHGELQAVLQIWAETAPDVAPGVVRASVLATSRALFFEDSDPGAHSAAELLLRRWGRAEPLQASETQTDRPSRPARATGPRWELGPNGHTLVVFPGPIVFPMGSPPDDPDRYRYEDLHYRRIDHSYALATTEVTVEQFRAFRPGYQPERRYASEPGCPAGSITWYQALRYCNWLSAQAGIEPAGWCYPEKIGPGMELPPDAFERSGFRLPTEAEWEYACRAGTETVRFFGDSEEFLDRYAWTWLNSHGRSAPSGQLLPNPFGLFDMLGNLWEWCHDGPQGDAYYPPYPQGTKDHPAPDTFTGMPVNKEDWRIVRGGVFDGSPARARTPHRDILVASVPRYYSGFRVARTLPQPPPLTKEK
jgi:formylglycine-generating enzyme required for sulfatase activity